MEPFKKNVEQKAGKDNYPITNTNTISHSIMASVTTFKSAIIHIRDILRGPGMAITGMDSMRHICLYILSRYMTKEKAESMGVPVKFAWETLMEEALIKNGGLQNALDFFYHTEEDCLVHHFDRLFGTNKFSFDIKNPQKHKEILVILNEVNMFDVDCQMDILGWVYEQHLKKGSSTAGRDLGQFFTDRFICEYMTKLCAPGFKKKGVPESVCDPSMGTGGFLTSFIKYYKKYHANKKIDWSVQQQQIYGNDTDPRVAGVARLNLFMETGGCRTTNLLTHDSLYGDLTQTGYDVILANMPFGLKGIKHAECCDRVQKLNIRGTKSEPLFLQLMMVSLNHGGRCAVVVPDGMLTNSSTCHNGTRKYLMDNFELKRVIKMCGQFFMNTSIQPSILFFENTGKPTTVVEFWDVVKGENGIIEEKMILSVPREKINESFSLDMRRYQEEKVVVNLAGFPIMKLEDVCNLVGGKGNYTHDGDAYPYYDSNGITGRRKDFLYDGEYVVTARSLSIGSVHYVSGKYWPSDHTINIRVKSDTTLSSRFLYYWLLFNNQVLKDLASGIKPGIRMSDVAKIKMPIPPLVIQHEIIATLDRIYSPDTSDLFDTLSLTKQVMDLVLADPTGAMLKPVVEAQQLAKKSAQMATDVKVQMVAIMKSVKRLGFPIKKLADACDISKGKRCLEAVESGGYPYQDIAKISRMVAKYILDGPAVLTPRAMSIGRFVYTEEKCHPSDDMFILKPKGELIAKYVYYYAVLILSEKFKQSFHGIKPTIDYSVFDYTHIVIPPIAIQQSFISRIDSLQAQLDVFQAFQLESENNARFILELYLGSAEVEKNKEEALIDSPENEIEEAPVTKVVKRKKLPITEPEDVLIDSPEDEIEEAPITKVAKRKKLPIAEPEEALIDSPEEEASVKKVVKRKKLSIAEPEEAPVKKVVKRKKLLIAEDD